MTSSTTRNLMVGLMMTVLVGAGRPAFAEAAETPVVSPFGGPQGRRVRSSSAAITALIQQAIEQSKTFRGLVATIDASDSFVYVEEGTCGHGVRACFVNVTVAGSHRVLWVKVDTRKADTDLMWLIGHELRHTIEVLGNRAVTSQVAMYFFYSQMVQAQAGGRAFETAAATEAGEAVRAEVRQQSSHADAR